MSAAAASSRSASVALELAGSGGVLALLAWAVQSAASLPAATVAAVLGAYAMVALPVVCCHHAHGLTPADRVTLARSLLVALLAGLLPWSALLGAYTWWLAGAAATALALDAADGAVARRTGTATDFGARFDMELDAALLLVLCAWLAALERTGIWVLAIGGLRYAFLGAGIAFPALAAPLPPRWRRKAVCALQGAVLGACLVPPFAPLAEPAAGVALALLGYSFGADIVWLLRRHCSKTSEASDG